MKAKISLRGMLCLINRLLNRKTLLVIITFLLSVSGVSAQQTSNLQIKGTVTSAANNQPLNGATIKIKKTTQITVTNEKGEFSLRVGKGEGTLEISFLGYKNKEIGFKTTSTNLSIQLDPDENLLSDVDVVVSTGYQNIPKERATGSFVHIDNKLLNRSVSTDIISRLKGIAPSLLFDERAGGEPKLSIRGRSTIFANADPLIVVDNFPYEGDLSNINPNDVEDISILRDAAAASIWGVRAGNGVIVITTKKGKKNQPLKISVNSSVTVGAKPDLWYQPRISSSDYIDIEQYLFSKYHYKNDLANTQSYPMISPVVEILANSTLSETEKESRLNSLRNADIRKGMNEYLYRNSVNQQYAVNLQGGSEKSRYYYSVGYDKNLDNRMKNGYDRLNLTANQDFTLVKDLQLSTSLVVTKSKRESNNVLGFLDKAYPYESIADQNGNSLPISRDRRTSFQENAEAAGRLNWQFYPLEELDHTENTADINNYRASAGIHYKLFAGLSAEIRYQYERQHSDKDYHQSQNAYYVRNLINSFSRMHSEGIDYNVPLGDILERGVGRLDANNGRAQLNYNSEFKNSRHVLSLISGFEVRESTLKTYNNRYFGYDSNTGTSLPVNSDSLFVQYPNNSRAKLSMNNDISGTLERFRSYYFNGAYTFDGKYTVSSSARIDQTNLFGVKTNQRSIPLWSTGLKWDLDKEGFYRGRGLPKIQLRTSYGYNGNFDPGSTAYITASYFTTHYGSKEARLGQLPNPSLKGEKTAVWNFGLDFSTPNRVIWGSIEYYKKSGKNLIGDGLIDASTGRAKFRGNVASMKGHGWDIELNSLLTSGKFSWTGSFLFSQAEDYVSDYQIEPTSSSFFGDASLMSLLFINPIAGKPLFAVYSYPWAGLDPQTGDPMGYFNGKLSKDYKAITGDSNEDNLVYHGRVMPAYFGGFKNAFSYDKISVSFNITYKINYYFRRQSTHLNYSPSVIAHHPDFAKSWKQPGDEKITDVPSVVYPANSNRNLFYERASILVEKGDHIRLQDIQLNYNWRTFTIYAYANNLGLLWKANKQGLDPDYNSNSSLGNTSIPIPRTFSIGFRANIY